MRLRENRRLPGRYREDEIPELPPNPTAVEQTVPFDPTLRPAAFPTLSLDQFYSEPTQETASDSTFSQAPALVFRDHRTVEELKMAENLDDPGEFVPRIGEEPEGQLSGDFDVSWPRDFVPGMH